jgi:hypothetical protein
VLKVRIALSMLFVSMLAACGVHLFLDGGADMDCRSSLTGTLNVTTVSSKARSADRIAPAHSSARCEQPAVDLP